MELKTDIELALPFSIESFRQRRRHFQEQMAPESVALFFSASPQRRSADLYYPFRQDSDFFYLTGFSEENAILVLKPREELLYVQARDSQKEIWEGVRLGPERVPDYLGITEAKDSSCFFKGKNLESILDACQKLYYRFGIDKARDLGIFSTARRLIEKARRNMHGPDQIISPDSILHEMRMIKSSEELKLLKENAKITHKGHMHLLEHTHPGMFEYELEAMLEYEFRRCGASQAYNPIVASGANSCILHYTQNRRQFQKGELILVDAAAEKHCMSTDLTRTFPVDAKFKPLQKEVYEMVLLAQKKAIDCALPGRTLEDVHDKATITLIEALIALKVLKGDAQKHFEDAKEIEKAKEPQKSKKISYQRYFMHKTSHWLGMDVHDVGSYYHKGVPRPLEKGMVCTIEPGLYFAPDDDSLAIELRGLGVRIEDDICIEDEKALVLTSTTPKEVYELENIRAACLEKYYAQ